MVQTTIRLPEALHQRLKAKAKERGLTLNAYVVSILHGMQEKKGKSHECQ